MHSSFTKNIFSPVLTVAIVTALLAGCSRGTANTSQLPGGTQAAGSTPVVLYAKYRDGMYSATVNYRDPAALESVDVSLKLKDGIITDATFQGNPQGKRAQQFQDLFASGYKELVVGKSINEVSLGVVNGSSLTSKGFMDAVQQIRTQAAAS